MTAQQDDREIMEESGTRTGVAQVSDDVFINIARICVSEIEGVAQLTSGPTRGLKGLLRGGDATRGVRVEKLDRQTEDRIVLDVHLLVDKGAPIPKVCESVQRSLKDSIEKMLNKEVVQVNVHVEGIRDVTLPEVEESAPPETADLEETS